MGCGGWLSAGMGPHLLAQVAFLLLAIHVALDANEHSEARSVRALCLPWPLLRALRAMLTTQEQRGSKVFSILAQFVFKSHLDFLGLCFEKTVRSLATSPPRCIAAPSLPPSSPCSSDLMRHPPPPTQWATPSPLIRSPRSPPPPSSCS